MQPRITEYLELTDNRHPEWSALRQVRLIKRMPERNWIMEGTLGGWVSSEKNLEGQAWIDDKVMIFNDNVRVKDKAIVTGNVRLWGQTQVKDDAYVVGSASGIHLRQSVIVAENAELLGTIFAEGNIEFRNYAVVSGAGSQGLHITNGAMLFDGQTYIKGYGSITGRTIIGGGKFTGPLRLDGPQLFQTDHLLTVSPVGSEGVTARLYRTGAGEHALSVGCWDGTVEELDAEVEHRAQDWHASDTQKALWKSKYALLKQMCEMTINGWDK